ncbi:unnamed protein product [Arctogadus glacialis]
MDVEAHRRPRSPGGRTLTLPSQAARVQSSAHTPCSPAARRSIPRLQPQLTPPLHIDPSSMETPPGPEEPQTPPPWSWTRGASDPPSMVLDQRSLRPPPPWSWTRGASDPPLHGPGPEELLASSLEPQTPPSMVHDQRSF